jgi:tetraacyldisaccharide 4'-kinase
MLKPLSFLYGSVVNIRNMLYDREILPVHKTPPVVVSIGNIEAGGTGKTPLAMALAEDLLKRGRRVSILTRGYRGSLKGPVLVQARHRADEAGDEALLMARSLNVPVIKSPDRVRGALFAYTHFGSEIVILDDGFQHRRLHRDMDIVLVSRDISQERLLPAGPLREPPSSLRRADFTIAMKGAHHEGIPADLKPQGLIDLQGNMTGLDAIAGKSALAFCAIGKPSHFFSLVESLGVKVEGIPFGDHHRYGKGDIIAVLDKAAGKDVILTTEKDLVKIDPHWLGSLSERLFAVRVAIEMPELENIADEIERLAEDSRVP